MRSLYRATRTTNALRAPLRAPSTRASSEVALSIVGPARVIGKDARCNGRTIALSPRSRGGGKPPGAPGARARNLRAIEKTSAVVDSGLPAPGRGEELSQA